MSSLKKLKALADQLTTHEVTRKQNLKRLRELFEQLDIGKKHSDFESIFEYKAMNVSGISLESQSLLAPKEKRYVQIIAISYEDDRGIKRAVNKNLAYFGRAENLDIKLRKKIVEFIFCWRYEKSFHNVEYYGDMIKQLRGNV